MSRTVRALVTIAAVLVLVAPSAADARSGVSAPAALKGFLVRVDEPAKTSFPRTPSFAWAPVPGTLRYEFQLSLSSTFRENGIIFSDTSLTTPVAAPQLTLPWITGEPHALYARVRAVLESSTTEWSAPFGFDVEPADSPKPLASYPGLLRWTPVDGATNYEVWFVDIPKIVRTTTNVVDEREFYTLHQAASWLSTVRWRVRARRLDLTDKRANGLPASIPGPWSPVYSSVNPPFAVGPLQPTATVSDVVSTGAARTAAHRLMPAFVFGGNQLTSGVAQELYRVHVFTDRRCLNRVYTSAIVGSPAYAPRRSGPLVLPRSSTALSGARNTYLKDGPEGQSFLADGELVVPNEDLPKPEPTVGLPAGTTTAAAKPDTSSGSGSTPTTPATSAAPAAPATPATPAAPAAPAGSKEAPKEGTSVPLLAPQAGGYGPPTDIWDTDWANGGGYYWTVIPVAAVVPDASQTTVTGGTAIAATTLPVVDGTSFNVGDTVSVGLGGNLETATIIGTTTATLTVGAPLRFGHGAGEPIVRTNGAIEYKDAELAQDACAAGRVMRFGKESEPAVTSSGDPFVTGLTPDGEIASADGTPEFYGPPLVAWTTALGASVYAVQWSKTRVPFRPEADPATTATGILTPNTSAVLPLEPGNWYYRVRGYSYSLPTGAQALSWSDVQKVVSSPPTFKVVSDGDTPQTKEIRLASAGFAIRVPKSWSGGSRSTQSSSGGARFTPLGSGSLRLTAREGKQAALFVQSAPNRSVTSHAAWSRRTIAALKNVRGRMGAPACTNVSLPGGAAVRCALSLRVAGGTQTSVVYALQHRNTTYTLTFAGAGRGKSAVFASAARSFRFTS
jgi:hypothetical protein